MKQILFICLLLHFSCLCFAQSDWKSQSDSMALQSRYKADIVLSHFNTLSGKKMLYSLQDREYIVIIQFGDDYKCFVLSMNNDCSISQIKEVNTNLECEVLLKQKFPPRKKRKCLKQFQEERQAIRDAFILDDKPIFSCITFPEAVYVAGVPSYFVIKDEHNIRYCEYCFSSLTAPCPISPNLYVYLLRTLSEAT